MTQWTNFAVGQLRKGKTNMARLSRSDANELRLHLMDIKEIGEALFTAMPNLPNVDIAMSKEDLQKLGQAMDIIEQYQELVEYTRNLERKKRAGGNIE